jgi:hypothetical protein
VLDSIHAVKVRHLVPVSHRDETTGFDPNRPSQSCPPFGTTGTRTRSADPRAKLIEYPEGDHVPFTGDAETIVGDIQEFVTGERESSASEAHPGDSHVYRHR